MWVPSANVWVIVTWITAERGHPVRAITITTCKEGFSSKGHAGGCVCAMAVECASISNPLTTIALARGFIVGPPVSRLLERYVAFYRIRTRGICHAVRWSVRLNNRKRTSVSGMDVNQGLTGSPIADC